MLKQSKNLSLCLILPLFMTACSMEASSTIQADVVTYNREFQTQAAGEFKKLKPPCPRDYADGNCSTLHRMIIDFKYMRDQATALIKNKKE